MHAEYLDPSVSSWFFRRYGAPTPVQAEVWPAVAAGEHVLATAPTGSGKTLAAFLVALSRFAEGSYPAEGLSVLYVSPLKALNEDIRRNLLEPLASLREHFEGEGRTFPAIRVETRSGDTPQAERRRFLSRPPAVLAVTPESLAILLLNPRGRAALSTVRCLVLDEVHAVLGTKRGAFLACQVGRLAAVAGEFQRIALSATVRPLEAAADWVGAYRLESLAGGLAEAGDGGPDGAEAIDGTEFLRSPRRVRIIAPPAEKRIELTVEFPAAPPMPAENTGGDRNNPRYGALVELLAARVAENRTTLVFTDSRRRAERIAFLLNERCGEGTAFAHHGSLSKEVRRAVEERLAEGRLPCVVATGSLELGIDIGAVDEVVLAGSPSDAAATLQRIGRSGHGVGRTSRGRLVPFHGMDLLAAAAVAGAAAEKEIEEVRPIENPLDLLAQVMLALCAERVRGEDELYAELRSYPPFRNLGRPSFDRVAAMLAGKYEGSRLRDLKPRLRSDGEGRTLEAVDGVLSLLYSSGGAIPDRGSYSLRTADGAKIGDLDEEFVWERRPGDAFSFGTRSWRILSIGAEAVQVVPMDRHADFVPFWRGEARFRSPVLSRRIREIVDSFELHSPLNPALEGSGFTREASESLLRFLEAQKRAQGGLPLPSDSAITVETLADPVQHGEMESVVVHTLRGGGINYPLALALAAELEELLELRIETIPEEDGILVVLPRTEGGDPGELVRSALFRLTDPGRREEKMRERLEASGLFGAAFREAAERSLLLPKAGFGRRTPLWITRRRAKRLFEAVLPYGDFPAVAEAWRTCLGDLFDPGGVEELCAGLREGRIAVHSFTSKVPSPFARESVWRETNRFLYEGDEGPERRGTSLSDRVISDALGDASLRPRIGAATAADFGMRLRREAPGWAPEDGPSLEDWIKERTAVDAGQWEALLAAAGEDLRSLYGPGGAEEPRTPEARSRESPAAEHPSVRRGRLVRLAGPVPVVVHRDRLEEWQTEGLALLGEWLRYQGPISVADIGAVFAAEAPEVDSALEALERQGELVRFVSVGDEEGLVCDRENLDLLLRLSRKASRPAVRERPASLLVPYLARRQGLIAGAAPTGGGMPWDSLACYGAPARLWETELFPARSGSYRPVLLDGELAAGRLLWFGCGDERTAFCAPEDLELSLPPEGVSGTPGLFSGADRPMDFWQLKELCGLGLGPCAAALWEEAWAGRLSSDTWEPLRRGLAEGFVPRQLPEAAGGGLPAGPFGRPRRIPRALRDRGRSGPPVTGRWFSLEGDDALRSAAGRAWDDLDREAADRDRVRLLLRRWGVLCRPLLERELPELSWGRLLPAMRRLELAGELTAGRFFSGVSSLQFASPRIVAELEECDAEEGIYWMNAADPAYPAGAGIEGLHPELPSRSEGNRIAFRGSVPAAVSRRSGKELRLFLGPDDPDLPAVLSFLAVPRRRAVNPERKLTVERINGVGAAGSPYAPALRALGFEADRGLLVLW